MATDPLVATEEPTVTEFVLIVFTKTLKLSSCGVATTTGALVYGLRKA
jgi:hypothetical protein